MEVVLDSVFVDVSSFLSCVHKEFMFVTVSLEFWTTLAVFQGSRKMRHLEK